MAAAGPDSKSDTSENVAIGFAFNALSTIFVMLMASCAKLAGGYPAYAMVPRHHDATGFTLRGTLEARGTCAHRYRCCTGQHGLPVMEIVLARSSIMLVCSLVTVTLRRQDPRGNRQWLLTGRSLVGFSGTCIWTAVSRGIASAGSLGRASSPLS